MEGEPNKVDLFDLPGRQHAMEQLKALGNFWVGPDVTLDRKVIIPPLGLVHTNIIVNKSDFPEINMSRGALGSLQWSVRSCLAQSGTEIMFYRGYVSDDDLHNLKAGKNVKIPVLIENHVNRPVELEGRVMRFFWVNFAKSLQQNNLREAIGLEFIIEGEEGKDWSFVDADFDKDTPVGVRPVTGIDPKILKDVCIKLAVRQKFHIPESKETLRVQTKKDLSNVLKPIPEGLKTRFQIGETVKVTLSKDIIAVVMTGAYDKSKRHILSPLIDGGWDGPIRTETLENLDYIELFLYRK